MGGATRRRGGRGSGPLTVGRHCPAGQRSAAGGAASVHDTDAHELNRTDPTSLTPTSPAPSRRRPPTPTPTACANVVANPGFEENAVWQINVNGFNGLRTAWWQPLYAHRHPWCDKQSV
jgi:hypothetical protein